MRSAHRLAGSLAWPSADTMKYFFAASGRALRAQLEAPGVSRRQRFGVFTTTWFIASSFICVVRSLCCGRGDIQPRVQLALAGLELGRRYLGQHARLDLGADLGHAHGKLAAGARQVDAAGPPVGLVLAPLDQAATLKI